MPNFKNDVFFDGNSVGSGRKIGNIKRDVIYDGNSPGSGRRLGNVKNGYPTPTRTRKVYAFF